MQKVILSIYFLVFTAIGIFGLLYPEKDKTRFRKVAAVLGLAGIIFGVALIGLNSIWYGEQQMGDWKWFDDAGEWLWMDKIGHFFTTYFQGRFCVELLKLAGVPVKRAVWIGSFAGMILLSPVEIMDAYSVGYGASVADLIANFCGSLFVLIQFLWFGNIKLFPKFSFHQTLFAVMRPALLGRSIPEQFIKDYNGQTYWFSFSLKELFRIRYIPSWLQLSFGIGAEGMTGGFDNAVTDAEGLTNISNKRYRQFYISFDINAVDFKARNKMLKAIYYFLTHFKLPAPALEFNTLDGFRWHWIYF